MTRSNLSRLAGQAVAAYGGEILWSNARMVRLELSAWGWAFRLKWQRPLRRVPIELDVQQPRATIDPIDRQGNRGILVGIEAHSFEVVS